MDDGRPGEFELIKRYFAPLAKDPGSLGLSDDAAVFSPRQGYDLVLTKDLLAADVHFFADDAPEAIAAKSLRVNLSDLAAKGARPRGYLLGLALPSNWNAGWLERFCGGLAADQAAYGIDLFGGDTIGSGNGLLVSITAIGEVPSGRAVRRSGARPGDRVFVSGTIGDAAAGLKARLDKKFGPDKGVGPAEMSHILDRYLLPRPRTDLADAIASHASAAMDVSDGLFADAAHMASASGVDIVIDIDKVPLSAALAQLKENAPTDLPDYLNGGDDFEILACVPDETAEVFETAARAAGCPVIRIGSVEAGQGNVRVERSGQPCITDSARGFRHF